MILIDTNVISELWRVEPDPGVLAWMDLQSVDTLYLSVMTVAELRFGLAVMPEGRRRAVFQGRLEGEVLPAFQGRILPFDLDAAQAYATLMARARAQGLAIAQTDGYIAATASVHGLHVATRDVAPFHAAGLPVINPWKTQR